MFQSISPPPSRTADELTVVPNGGAGLLVLRARPPEHDALPGGVEGPYPAQVRLPCHTLMPWHQHLQPRYRGGREGFACDFFKLGNKETGIVNCYVEYERENRKAGLTFICLEKEIMESKRFKLFGVA